MMMTNVVIVLHSTMRFMYDLDQVHDVYEIMYMFFTNLSHTLRHQPDEDDAYLLHQFFKCVHFIAATLSSASLPKKTYR